MSDAPLRFKVAFRAAKCRDGKAVRIEGATPAEPQVPKRQVSRIARMLALAHFIERQIGAGDIKDYADAARRLGVSRARMSQIVNLLLLPVETQEGILTGRVIVSERRLRSAEGAAR